MCAVIGRRASSSVLTTSTVLQTSRTHHRLKTGRSHTDLVLDEQGESAEPEGNCRNGFSAMTVLGDSSEMAITLPRVRHSSFEPLLVPKWQKKLPGFEDKIIALYARSMSVRDIKAMLEHLDALRVRIRDEGTVRNKAVYRALGVAADGTREVLGLWIEQNEGVKFW